MMAQGQPGCALFGEYVLGRLFLVLGTLVLYKTERLSLGTLLGAVCDTIRGNPDAFPDKAGQRTPEDISKELSLRNGGAINGRI